jgi:hypothetical protein
MERRETSRRETGVRETGRRETGRMEDENDDYGFYVDVSKGHGSYTLSSRSYKRRRECSEHQVY